MDEQRRQAIDRMFRARLSWTLLAGVGLIGLTAGLSVSVRGGLLSLGIASFLWLNLPLGSWIVRARLAGDPRWQPAALGMALRIAALIAVIVFSW